MEIATMPSRAVVIGARGYLGRVLVPFLTESGFDVIGLGRRPPAAALATDFLSCDATNAAALRSALVGIDTVVNLMTGSPGAMLRVAENLSETLRRQPTLRLVQLSSLAVLGQMSGVLDETVNLTPATLHAYGAAKLAAERSLLAVPGVAGRCVIIRPGCIYGPGSPQWVDRLCRLLLAGRLGWLGAEGAGLSPLVHVRDVARAIASTLRPSSDAGIYHLLSPETLTWNVYFRRLGRRLGIDTITQIHVAQLETETWITGPARALLSHAMGRPADRITPAMRHLFRSTARPASARRPLLPAGRFIPHETGIAEAVSAFLAERALESRRLSKHWEAAA
jgi:nucleoside-diphosphate-sugar epimerase